MAKHKSPSRRTIFLAIGAVGVAAVVAGTQLAPASAHGRWRFFHSGSQTVHLSSVQQSAEAAARLRSEPTSQLTSAGAATGQPSSAPSGASGSPTGATSKSPTSKTTFPSVKTSTSTSKAATTTPPSSSAGSAVPSSNVVTEVIRLTNVQRLANGCPALTANSVLNAVAQAHSADMAKNNYFSHNSQDGRTPFDRMTAAGYQYSSAAENIAAGQPTPAAVVDAWMNSSGHRANILNCGLTQIGIGYATGGSYGAYWTQDFGTPR